MLWGLACEYEGKLDDLESLVAAKVDDLFLKILIIAQVMIAKVPFVVCVLQFTLIVSDSPVCFPLGHVSQGTWGRSFSCNFHSHETP